MENKETESGLNESETVWKSDGPSDGYGIQALSDRSQKVLRYISENPPAEVSVRKISDATDLTRYKVEDGLEELQEKHFLKVSGSNRSKQYDLTPPAELALEKSGGVCAQKSDSSQSKESESSIDLEARLHNLSFVLPLHEDNYIKWENKERVLSELGDILEVRPESKEFFLSREQYRVRITGENVVVYLRDEYKGLDVRGLKNEAFDELLRLKEWLSDELKLRFKDYSLLDVKIRSQHIAIENHPVVMAIDQSSQVSLQSIDPVRDEKGRIRLWLDHSEGAEIEAGNKGNPSGMRELAEDDVDFLMREDIGFKIQHKEGVRALNQLIKVLDRQGVDLSQLAEIEASQSSGVYNPTSRSGFKVDKTGSFCEAERVDLCEVPKHEVADSSPAMYASENKENDKAETLKNSTMSVSENSEVLDVRNLPGETLEDAAGNRMTVWFIDGLESSESDSEASESPEVVLKRENEKMRMDLEEIKDGIVNGSLSMV